MKSIEWIERNVAQERLEISNLWRGTEVRAVMVMLGTYQSKTSRISSTFNKNLSLKILILKPKMPNILNC
jgi:hypothetical protein